MRVPSISVWQVCDRHSLARKTQKIWPISHFTITLIKGSAAGFEQRCSDRLLCLKVWWSPWRVVTFVITGWSVHSRLIGHPMIDDARIDLERLLSIIRKLLQAMVWLFGIGFSALLIVGGMNEKQGTLMTGFGLVNFVNLAYFQIDKLDIWVTELFSWICLILISQMLWIKTAFINKWLR